MFILSCSTTISQLEDYKKVEFIETAKFKHTPEKYQIFIENEVKIIEKVLQNIKSVKIVEKIDNSTDYIIKTKMQIKKFGNMKINFGKVEIWNSKLNIMEEIFPISDLKTELNIYFAKNRGYILEKRVNRDDEVIFKISIGKNRNLKQGDILNIYSFKKDIKFLSQKNSLVKYKIGSAVVSDMIEHQFCWIYFTDAKISSKVSKGDIAISNQNNFSEYLEDGTMFMKNHTDVLQNNLRL